MLNVAAGVTGARWRGGTFVGYVDPDVDPRPGVYPEGVVLRIDGDDIVIEDVTVEGYNAIAIQVGGSRVRVLNPTIRKPQRFVPARGGYPQIDVNGAGIRVKHGTGFRCYGGTIDSGEDAAIQFSGDFRYTTETVPGVISDGLFKDVRCTALTGRLMLVGSTSPLIENVRFEGITGRTLGASGCIRVQNRGREVDEPSDDPKYSPIRRVVFRDIAVSHDDESPADGIAIGIENELTVSETESGDDVAISDIRLENVAVSSVFLNPFACWAAADPARRPIRDVSWRGGSIADPATGQDAPAISLSQLDGGLFQGLRVAGGSAHATIACGEEFTYNNRCCRNVTFVDVAVTGVASGQAGVRFAEAVNCGIVRGRVAGSGGTGAGVELTADATRCFVEGADLFGVVATAKVRIAPGAADARVRDCHGDDLTVIPALGMGARAEAAMASHAIDARAGFLAAKTTAGTEPIALDAVNGGAAGDLLFLTRSTATGTKSIRARDAVPSGNLALAGNFTFTSGDDLLTLIRDDAGGWTELSRADNG